METKDKIKRWVMKDGIVKRGNKKSIERAIDLTIEKYEEIVKELDKQVSSLGNY
jgi:hypothetical protein